MKHYEVRKLRLEKKVSARQLLEIVNPMRVKRGANEIIKDTYYKKETGVIPIYLEEAKEFAEALGTTYDIFFKDLRI